MSKASKGSFGDVRWLFWKWNRVGPGGRGGGEGGRGDHLPANPQALRHFVLCWLPLHVLLVCQAVGSVVVVLLVVLVSSFLNAGRKRCLEQDGTVPV